MEKNIIEKIDNLVNDYVTSYKTDWYDLDRPMALQETEFLVSLRDTGVDCLWLNTKAKYSNMMWNEGCFEMERAAAIFHVKDGNITLINHSEAKSLLKSLMDNTPDGYIQYCKNLLGTDITPSVEEYKKYIVYRNEGGYKPLQEWILDEYR